MAETKTNDRKWLEFWVDTFHLFMYPKYQPFAKAICYMIAPLDPDWIKRQRPPTNDNIPSPPRGAA